MNDGNNFMTPDPILRVEHFSKHFLLHEQGKVIPSAHDLSFNVYPGSLTALIGPTGSGKSSVLKGIYRTYLPSSGSILYCRDGGETVDLVSADDHKILELRRDELGFVTQFLHALPRQATEEIVAQPLIQKGNAPETARSQARAMLAKMNLPERLWNISPATFSGGEKQRVNLARGFVAKPRLLLLDEPTASLDPVTTERVVTIIKELKEEGIAMLAIFHQPDLVEKLADHVVELNSPSSVPLTLEESA